MIVILLVAAISIALGVIASRAVARTGNKKLWYLMAAFAVLALKGLLVAFALFTEAIEHQHLELVSSLFDLGVVTLLVLPLLK